MTEEEKEYRDACALAAMHAMVSQERNIIAMAAEQGARGEICDDAFKVANQMVKARRVAPNE